MMKVEGKITDENGAAIPAYITIMDLVNSKRVHSARPAADGSYFLYLREGSKYEMSVDPEQSKISYFARQFDLTADKIPQREKINVVLKQPVPGDELAFGRNSIQTFHQSTGTYFRNRVEKISKVNKSKSTAKL